MPSGAGRVSSEGFNPCCIGLIMSALGEPQIPQVLERFNPCCIGLIMSAAESQIRSQKQCVEGALEEGNVMLKALVRSRRTSFSTCVLQTKMHKRSRKNIRLQNSQG